MSNVNAYTNALARSLTPDERRLIESCLAKDGK